MLNFTVQRANAPNPGAAVFKPPNEEVPMTKTLFASAVLALALPAQAFTLAQWTFENAIPDLNNSITSPSVGATSGTGTALGVHASGATDWSTPVGNGSANSFSSNTWAVNDYYEFSFSTVAYKSLMLSFDQTSSGSGPRDFSLAYSSSGSGFTAFTNYVVLANGAAPNPSWNSTTSSSAYTISFDLSSVVSLDNRSNVAIRLIDRSTVSANGGIVAAGGTNRVDNFTVTVTAVPEPGTYALLLAGLGMVGFVARRRRG